ncbi:MAG: ABC transporter ATPase [Flavobacteriales bacterium]|nr:ABC transporter ATPase [Flavobacteriales bacterium]
MDSDIRHMEMPLDARVWVFQAQRKLSPTEADFVRSDMQDFLSGWAAHGAELLAKVAVVYHRFVVVLLDEGHANASGCSIDKLTARVNALGTELNNDFLDRRMVAYMAGSGEVETTSLDDIKQAFDSGLLNEDTVVFNNLVQTRQEFEQQWKVPLGKSWHARFAGVKQVQS